MAGKTRFEMIKERHSKTYLQALKQGKVDPQIESLCSFIEKTENYYTSSSCSGRIMFLEKTGEKKKENNFHRRWHRTITKEELIEGINEKAKGTLWFKLEPFILHIGCANLENANTILECMKKAGVKRGGIIVAEKEKFIIELQGTGRMEFIAKEKNKQLPTNEYLEKALETANPLLEKNYERLEKLEKEFRKKLN
ncbi:MAG: hypothetical protein COV47_03810 [Candidatus Diapherotrites archaeon CG11_big_fil_rev_8_21_14_0_20_37_9]|nr:MAG: hypothetical protein COV47_03810 [Candidatus Diapherotrites archaeon CG11_big_fil_rev_8_21_14_0_20_37_9]